MRILVSVFFVAAALIVGCGDDDAADTTVPVEAAPSAPKGSNEVTVRLDEFTLDPAQASGGQAGLVAIRIRNDGERPHSLAVEGPNGLVELDGRVDPGARATLEVDLDKPGTYAWWCPLDAHRAKGMDGSITVGGSDPARGPESDDTVTTETETETTETETQTRTTTQTETVTTPTETDEAGSELDTDSGRGY